MGKAGRWLRSFLARKKDGKVRDREKQGQGDATASPREKKRWSFRRSASPGKAAAATSPSTPEPSVSGGGCLSVSERELEQSKHAMAVAVATAAAADAAVAAAQAAAAVIRLTASESDLPVSLVEEAAAVRIQATFRGYLARKALCALRGLVTLQALIRGHLVRKQATATLRRMQALLLAQSGLRAQRMRMLEDDHHAPHAAAAAHRRLPQHPRHRRSYEMDRSGEEHVKIVEMDIGEPPRRGRSSCSVAASESRERRLAEYYGQCSPAPLAKFTELMSPCAYSGHFEDFASFEPATARSSPYVPAAAEPTSEFFPSYMANTESSRAKARSQSAPRQRTDSPLERQPSRRRAAAVPRSVKMQRSSSHVGVPASAAAAYAHYRYQYPCPVKLDRSSVSFKDSECGSTSSVLTAATVGYCRSIVGFEVHRGQY